MAERILKRGIGIQCFASSTANRALTTAVYFAEAYGKSRKDILLFPELYHAPEETFYQVIAKLPYNCNTVALFSHNPGITGFVNNLTNTRIDNMPTCGIFAIKANTNEWNLFKRAEKEFWFFDYPKLDL